MKKVTPSGSALTLSDYCIVNGYVQNNSPKVHRVKPDKNLEGFTVVHLALLAGGSGGYVAPASAQWDAVGR